MRHSGKYMLSNLKKTIRTSYDYAYNEWESYYEAQRDAKKFSHVMRAAKPLTREEKECIYHQWGSIIKCIKRGFPYYSAINVLHGFNPLYVPTSYYNPYIVKILNSKEWKHQLSQKGLSELIYSSGIKHPVTVLRSYGGILLDRNFKPLLRAEARKVLSEYNLPLIYKPAVETSQGNGIEVIQPKDFDSLAQEIESGKIFNQCKEFVLQVPVKQSRETELFNPSSLNSMRITTLNLNGVVSVCSRTLKCGPKDSIVDNIGSGRRGVMVGIESDGRLKDFGFYGNGDIAYMHNDVSFAGYKIKHFLEVENAATMLHSFVPGCKIIGWDIALDENDDPVLIEGNTVCPGITIGQICSGPIFGRRTNEVIKYIIDYKSTDYK